MCRLLNSASRLPRLCHLSIRRSGFDAVIEVTPSPVAEEFDEKSPGNSPNEPPTAPRSVWVRAVAITQHHLEPSPNTTGGPTIQRSPRPFRDNPNILQRAGKRFRPSSRTVGAGIVGNAGSQGYRQPIIQRPPIPLHGQSQQVHEGADGLDRVEDCRRRGPADVGKALTELASRRTVPDLSQVVPVLLCTTVRKSTVGIRSPVSYASYSMAETPMSMANAALPKSGRSMRSPYALRILARRSLISVRSVILVNTQTSCPNPFGSFLA